MRPTFMQIGTVLQETAKTREEAIERFCESCNRCRKAGTCIERLCPIAHMHSARLLYFDAEEYAQRCMSHDHFVKTRQYNTTPQAQLKGRVKKYLHKVRREAKEKEKETGKRLDHDCELALDQAEVYAEDARFEEVIHVLNRASLKKIAKHVAKLTNFIKEK